MELYFICNINCKISTRQTTHVLKEVHGKQISYIPIANYTFTVTDIIKPFVDTFE